MRAIAARSEGFATPARWLQGQPFDHAVDSWVAGHRWLLVTSAGWVSRGAVARLEARLGAPSAQITDVAPNPRAEPLLEAPNATAEVIVALGGGSVIDFAKGVAAVAPIPRHRRRPLLFSHLRDGEPWPRDLDPLPLIAVPTTAGTGSEITSWGTLWDGDRKTSIDDERLRPRAIVLDPELVVTMPRTVALASALDALAHALEAVWNRAHTPLTDAFSSEAIRLLRADLEDHLAAPSDLDRAARLQVAASLAGLAMNGTRTALAHSISYALTSRWNLAHGLGCGLMLAELARLVLQRHRARLAPAAQALGCRTEDVPETLDRWLDSLAFGETLVELPEDAAGRCGADLLHPARAGNFLFDIDLDAATAALARAVARHRPATRTV